ncbi:MAG: FGGY family carbohydrate kinase [Gammaproteobacteria bacterium]|nr:FGGY family carbohydrate kinase [Gammaproteobacteria bacterium]
MSIDFLSSKELFLTIDQGGHATRAIAFNGQGVMIAETHQDIQVQHPREDYVEHDAQELVNSVQTVLNKMVETLGDRVSDVIAAGMATQRSNIVCWDKRSGKALTPIISWQDRRNHQWLKQFKPRAEEIHKTTGLFLSPHYGASKLRWCLENYPELQDALDSGDLCMGPMASYFVFSITKEHNFLTDVVNASRTQLWSLHTSDWDPALLKLFDIPLQALPLCKPSASCFGHIQLADKDIPLNLVTGDQSAAMFAYGHIQPDTAYINTGTGAFVSRPSGPLKIFGRRLLTSLINQSEHESQYVLEGTVNGAGSALSWLAEEHNVTDIENRLADWLEQVTSPPLFFNGISGLAAPFWIADFPTRFETENCSDAEKAVAVIESVVFLLCANIEEMQKLSSPPEQIQITGGLAIQDGLCQRLADLTGLPVYRPVECEATARGVAYLLVEEVDQWPEQEPGVWFEPANNPGLEERYTRWTQTMLAIMRN